MRAQPKLHLAFLHAALLASVCGCHSVYPGRKPDGPVPYVPPQTARELCKVSLPDYMIEPPDVLSIEAISLVPRQPYHLGPLDAITVFTEGLPEELNLGGEFVVQANGTVQLGFELGAVQAVGKTVDELRDELLAKLTETYAEPQVVVTLTQIAAQQQIAGEHLVAPDGKVNLGAYGRVAVVGLTMEEAKAAIEYHLSQYLESPKIALDVVGYNSKVFYVITQGAGLGDRVIILPSKGNETVLDAIGQVQGLDSTSSTRMWVARPGSNECGGDQILPVDWLAVTQRGDVATNYQVMPGDRVYVSEDKLVAFDTALGKVFSPFERIFGVTLLGTQTAQRVVFFNQNNGGGQGFNNF
ncbi:MAG: polysaccharide biosynthesis/export family protein [Planctomycetales bacterium]|nr:polysaccharide biosynthesis/export family protein [Planctomycetales bacterium]